MHKIAQKVTSVALAASMLLSMFAVNTVAFADEFKDNTTVSDEVTEAPVSDDEVDAVESVDKTDTSNSESEDTPVESPEPSQTMTDVVDLTHDSTADTVKDDTANSEDVVYTESDTSEDVIATPETAEPFIGIQAVTPDYGDKISAEVGDTVTLDALLNRDDVSVTYQWQKKQAFAADESYAIYPYEEDEPTWYNFIIEDTTETAVLADKPDYVWQGCEMYYAVVDALDEIGADSSNVQIAYHTPNFVLDGYTITAANAEDGTVEVYASNGESTYTAHLNDDGKWEFGDEAAASQDTDWQNIEGATEPTYTFEVTENDLTASYRCLITVTDEAYKEANFKALEELGHALNDEDKAGDIIIPPLHLLRWHAHLLPALAGMVLRCPLITSGLRVLTATTSTSPRTCTTRLPSGSMPVNSTRPPQTATGLSSAVLGRETLLLTSWMIRAIPLVLPAPIAVSR